MFLQVKNYYLSNNNFTFNFLFSLLCDNKKLQNLKTYLLVDDIFYNDKK